MDKIVNTDYNVNDWYPRVKSQVSKEQIMFKGAYHELTKEKDRHTIFNTVLKFIASKLQSAKAIGEIKPTDFKFGSAVKKSGSKSNKLRILLKLIILYLVIGILRWLRLGGSKSANLFFWPIVKTYTLA
eukprot:CAMPEP_0116880512 /NCGR_PEP_ID=MMETSP0463-20121206/12456_1 /TAXON_ID=181622 /ORGANISM="Strombidinopsis sp, Strain SopsisLIS2011" /LENGTH=128 /DNA_ID=CAMNT_0004531195 /DNA_START=870 /DNA_END=1252 /DNA_ORIENTATION=+